MVARGQELGSILDVGGAWDTVYLGEQVWDRPRNEARSTFIIRVYLRDGGGDRLVTTALFVAFSVT